MMLKAFLFALLLSCGASSASFTKRQGAHYVAHHAPHEQHRHSLAHALSNTSVYATNSSDVNGSKSKPTISEAERLLAIVIAQQSAYNNYRVANPRRNTYTLTTRINVLEQDDPDDAPRAPVLNETILAAAALIAERDAALHLANGTLDQSSKSKPAKRSQSYWLPQMSGNGLAPMGSNPSYQVYRDVTDPKFGAKGDGVTDDTAAINAAIAYDDNCGSGCLSSSIKGTLIYFPPGTYLISSPINAYYYSQLVGDALDIPTIKTSASFIGLGAIQTDVYIPNDNGNEWYIEQSNFYRQVRNFFIDISSTTTASAAGLHWQVAQATSLTNVTILASLETGESNTQMGIFTENGSGGFMSDVQIIGGAYGIYGGNQQYTVRNFQIMLQTKACICLLWDWGWTWSNLNLQNAPIGISLINPQGTSGQSVAGSTYIMDSTFESLATGVYAHFAKSGMNSSIIVFDNVAVNSVSKMLEYTGGETVAIPAGDIDFVVVGEVVDQGSFDGSFSYSPPARQEALVTDNSIVQKRYFARSRPQYETLSTSEIINVKTYGAHGDGVHDDTEAVQLAFLLATANNLIYFPAGSYLISSTLQVFHNTRLTGEVWSQLVATGSHFANMSSPQPMLRVGHPGDVGIVEISDMLFTSVGALPGLILVEWNIRAGTQGSAGIWDSHFRVGGAYGTDLQVGQCPYTQALRSQCTAASMMLHMTNGSNGYFENMWAWVADHDIDDPQNSKISIAAARGILVESQGPTWLYGTASEHSILYQYNFANSTNTFAGMIQTESPYYQGASTGESPGPFNSSIGLFAMDPVFPGPMCNGTSLECNFAWALMMQSSTNLTIAGAGLYSWFADFEQECVDTQNCQQRIAYDDSYNSQLQLWNLITIGSVEMVSVPQEGTTVSAKQFTEAVGHPYWSAVAGYLDSSEAIMLSCTDNDTRPICADEPACDLSPTFTTFLGLNIYAALGLTPDECIDFLAINTLYNVLNASVANYSIVNQGYDSAFGYYQQYMHDLLPSAISSIMAPSTPGAVHGGPGNQFFECTCHGYGPQSTQRCPFTYTQLMGAESFTMTYQLTNASGFNATLSAHGIDPSWVTFGDVHTAPEFGCSKLGCIRTNYAYIGIPQAASNVVIPNPKTYVTQAMSNISTIQTDILAAQMLLDLGGWNGSSDDLIQAYSMPVFLFEQAVASMATAKSIGQQQAREDKIKLIEEILTGVFAVLPFVNEFLPEIEVLRSIASYVALAGNSGFALQSVIEDPSLAPVAIIGLLLGGLGDKEEAVSEAAAARRAMSTDDVDNLGSEFSSSDKEFQNTVQIRCDI